MTDDPTKDLTDSYKLNLIHQTLDLILRRLNAIVAQEVDTARILDQCLKEMVQMRETLIGRLDKINVRLERITQ